MIIYVFGDGGVSDQVRAIYPLRNVADAEVRYGIIVGGARIPVDKNAVYVFPRPMTMLENAIIQIKEEGIPVIIDMDDNFWNIPKTHIGYPAVGPKTENVRSLERNMLMADFITFSTEHLRQYVINNFGIDEAKTVVIPNVCNLDNQWNCYKRPSKHIRYGFSGTLTHREDFGLIVKPLIRAIMDTQDSKAVIGCDPEIYRMLRTLPESKKMFVPTYRYEEYPIQLSYFDVMLIPLVNDTFNCSKSDIKILDAIANGKPFIASDVLPYKPYIDSGAGLVIPNTEEDWYTSIRYLSSEKNRKAMAETGLALAKTKSVSNSSKAWQEVINNVTR